ncbi:MAG TPA: hypothetical protein VK388_18150 [Pyrinomonadaceae bacterium]|nr:hypothetical protein [Pyrinomonadaceae bacterium]
MKEKDDKVAIAIKRLTMIRPSSERVMKQVPSLTSGLGFRFRITQPLEVHVDERAVIEYLNSSPETKEVVDFVREIEASRKRSQKTQKEIIKLRKQNQALLDKL